MKYLLTPILTTLLLLAAYAYTSDLDHAHYVKSTKLVNCLDHKVSEVYSCNLGDI